LITSIHFSHVDNTLPNGFERISLAFLSSDQKDGLGTKEVEFHPMSPEADLGWQTRLSKEGSLLEKECFWVLKVFKQ